MELGDKVDTFTPNDERIETITVVTLPDADGNFDAIDSDNVLVNANVCMLRPDDVVDTLSWGE